MVNKIKAAGAFATILAAINLTGCAGALIERPIAFSAAKEVPSSRVLAFGASAGQNTMPIEIKRDGNATTSSACYAEIFVNDKPAALLDKGEKVTLYVKPGYNILGAQTKESTACIGELKEISAKIDPLTPNHFRVYYDMSGSINFDPTATK